MSSVLMSNSDWMKEDSLTVECAVPGSFCLLYSQLFNCLIPVPTPSPVSWSHLPRLTILTTRCLNALTVNCPNGNCLLPARCESPSQQPELYLNSQKGRSGSGSKVACKPLVGQTQLCQAITCAMLPFLNSVPHPQDDKGGSLYSIVEKKFASSFVSLPFPL